MNVLSQRTPRRQSDPVEIHPDFLAHMGAGNSPDRPRLGLLHHGDRPTKIHERRAALQRQAERRLVLSAVHLHVDHIDELGMVVRLVDLQEEPEFDEGQEDIHHNR